MNAETSPEDLGFGQVLNLILSVLTLTGLAVETLLPLRPAAAILFDQIDFVVCFFFLFDFFKRFIQAPSKFEFMRWGWIDFISSLPIMGVLQWGRIARVLRILRVLRVFRSANNLWRQVSRNPPKATFRAAIVVAITTYILASISILEFETSNDANIKTPDEALWWSFSTMITVGCEKYPVTRAGHIIGGFLSIVGVGMTSIYTAYIASLFISSPSPTVETTELLIEIKRLTVQLRCHTDLLETPRLEGNTPEMPVELEIGPPARGNEEFDNHS